MRSTQLSQLKAPTPPQSATALAQMIERFNESSSRLEVQHAAILQEVEELKSKLQRKEEEVKRAERLSMLGETAAALAHEVRNPLGAITLFLSMLKSDISDRPGALSLAEEIEKSVSSLNHVVSNVLHFAKHNKLSLGPVNLHSILHEVRHHFTSLYGSKATVEIELSGSPFIIADDSALRQCFYNLVMNSLQITSFSGAIKIVSTDDSVSDGAKIVVSDNGPGIAEDVMPRIFEPFASGRREGTGLGLSIVRRIIEGHGGEITAQNAAGAEFVIVLPRRGKK